MCFGRIIFFRNDSPHCCFIAASLVAHESGSDFIQTLREEQSLKRTERSLLSIRRREGVVTHQQREPNSPSLWTLRAHWCNHRLDADRLGCSHPLFVTTCYIFVVFFGNIVFSCILLVQRHGGKTWDETSIFAPSLCCFIYFLIPGKIRSLFTPFCAAECWRQRTNQEWRNNLIAFSHSASWEIKEKKGGERQQKNVTLLWFGK